VDTDSRDYQDVIDQALQLVYSHHHRLVHQLYPAAYKALSLEQLRSGPLGQDLQRLSMLARGQIRESKDHVLTAIESIVQLLFWPAAADDYSVPRSFWDTDLGRMLALAKFKAFEPNELVSIGNAAQQLNVTRPTIYRWMDDRTLNYVRDDMSGRTFVVRRDIENLKNVARELEAQQSA
jgi:excisionase family DNA binding protein